jgi:uncharacterized membrane protein YhaH (DUF805 family)
MSFTEAINSCFRQYVGFSGRAPRSEFWYFQLFAVLLGIGAAILDPTGAIGGLISLALLLPSLAVSVRRLHDTNRSGWWILIGLIPLIGIILLIVWWASRGEPHSNRFGPPPLGQSIAGLPPTPGSAGGAESSRMNCPRCGESIAASAQVCRFCGLEFSAGQSGPSDSR